MKKILTLTIMLLFLLMSISSANEVYLEEQSNQPMPMGDTLHVGGSGPGNYTSIQDAIDNASDGDTVFVYDDSSPYIENLDVNKPMNIIGENRETAIINGSIVDDFVIDITADGVVISGFTLKQYYIEGYRNDSIINIESDYNIISGNIITGNTTHAISFNFLYGCNYTNISDNIITGIFWIGISVFGNFNTIRNNSISIIGDGISVDFGDSNKIIRNKIERCDIGISLILTKNAYIYRNIITNTGWGISDKIFSVNTTCTQNEFSYNHIGIFFFSNSINCKVIQNNFIGNNHSAYFIHMLILSFASKIYIGEVSFLPTINWDGNYWDEPKLQQYIIPGFIGITPILYDFVLSIGLIELPKNWINFDWHPTQEPYNI